MSRKPSKFRKRKREQREHRTLVHVDIETRMVTEKRNGVIKGHYHASEGPLCPPGEDSDINWTDICSTLARLASTTLS